MALGGNNHTSSITFVGIDHASGVVNNVRKNVTALGGPKFGPLGNLVSGLASMTGPALLAAGAIGAVAAAIPSAIKNYSDLYETINKNQVVFGDSAKSIEQWSTTSAKAMGLSQNAALGYAATFGNLFRSAGMAGPQMAMMSKGLVTLAADLASFNNIDPSVALDKLQSGIVGMARPLRELGVNLLDSEVQLEAQRQGFVKVAGQYSNSDKMLARYAIIMRQTATAQGDFARTSNGLANVQRTNDALFEDMSAKLGQGLYPIVTAFGVLLRDGVVPAVLGVIDSIGNLGTAFDNLHRFVDPAYARMEDLRLTVLDQAKAYGIDATALQAFIDAQTASTDATAAGIAIAKAHVAEMAAGSHVTQQSATDSLNAANAASAQTAALKEQAAARAELAARVIAYNESVGTQHREDAVSTQWARTLADAYAHENMVYQDTIDRHIVANEQIAQSTVHLTRATRTATQDALSVVKAFPNGIKAGLDAGKSKVKAASQDLKWAVEHPWATLRNYAWDVGQLTGKRLADALKSKNPEIRGAALLYQNTLRDELRGMPAYLWGTSIGDKILAGISTGLSSAHGTFFNINLNTPHRAGGGPVSAGMPYTVGEKGPETFVPSASGTIVPNGAAGWGSGDIVVKIGEETLLRIVNKGLGRQLSIQ